MFFLYIRYLLLMIR